MVYIVSIGRQSMFVVFFLVHVHVLVIVLVIVVVIAIGFAIAAVDRAPERRCAMVGELLGRWREMVDRRDSLARRGEKDGARRKGIRMEPRDDGVLLAAMARRGERAAADELFARYEGRAYCLAYNLK